MAPQDPVRVLRQVNQMLWKSTAAQHYATLFFGIYDDHARRLDYVNCGHNPAILFRAKTGTVSLLNSSCPPIGLSPEQICEQAAEDLVTGDVLVFYTDGVTEAENRLEEEFGLERLTATVRSGSSLSAEDLMTNIYNAAADFCSDNLEDDVTILVVKCNFEGTPVLTS